MGRFQATCDQNASSPPLTWNIEILAPTLLEYWAVQRTLPHTRVHWAGVRLARWKSIHHDSNVIVCGLAGALTSELAPGTVLIPHRVGLANGKEMYCDPTLVQALTTAARLLHVPLDTGPLLTASSMVVGNDRSYWAQQGFRAVDMETGFLLEQQNLRMAVVRVVLDNPKYDLSSHWLRPVEVLLQPQIWPQMFWLTRVAPRYALRAAQILKTGLGVGLTSISNKCLEEKE